MMVGRIITSGLILSLATAAVFAIWPVYGAPWTQQATSIPASRQQVEPSQLESSYGEPRMSRDKIQELLFILAVGKGASAHERELPSTASMWCEDLRFREEAHTWDAYCVLYADRRGIGTILYDGTWAIDDLSGSVNALVPTLFPCYPGYNDGLWCQGR